eukprot:TRINITY_DN6746_c0_g1_i1.p1 TRINITY_DN6746_c0_g1~~TRINITY_DN6746_c0_g1_i1.p1  ORF type:complete len:1802 (-),score=377.38 TRINITY_DN6746_c0_g1_i1:222-5627(-)
MSLPELGTYFWISEEEDSWFPYKLQEFNGESAVLVSPKGKTMEVDKPKLATLQTVHPTCMKGLDDMVHLGDLHEAGLLNTLRTRFENDKIYTYTGAILVSINPYQTLPIYTNEIMHSYRGQRVGSLPPHIFAIADNAYRNMCDKNLDQSIIISGESGAGKTEATKLILQYLAAVSGHHSWVEQQILDSSPVLEAFGNAKTIRNDNSSRFGKFIEIHFDDDNKICGASIVNYLLEKSRIVSQSPDERNYHIFYQLTAGATEEEREKYSILPVSEYRYLNQSGCVKIDHVDDAEEFNRVKMALTVLNMSDEEVDGIFRILSGILMLGNVNFTASADGESCTVSNPEVATSAAKIFGTKPEVLMSALTNRTNVIAGNAITVPLKASEAVEGRDAFAKSIYGRMFDWIVSRINDSIRQGKKKSLIGVLDIFGFEIFKQNSFEQLCINFANEKLQQHFNQFIFKSEQEEYSREKINWSNIDFVDNQECIDLVEKKPLGIISLIDEVCKAPKGGDQMMLEKFHKNHEKSPYYDKPRVNNGTFGVKHYAGTVTYHIDGFTEKNKDTLYFDYIEAMQMSCSDAIRSLFPEDNPKSKEKDKKRAPAAKQTVAFYFKDQLTSLMSTLNATQPHYVRCLKPNTTKTARKIDSAFLFRQLKYAGMIEAVRIRRLGFPVRRSPQEFANRFWMIGKRGLLNEFDVCKSVFANPGVDEKSWQIGLTKIFMQEMTYQQLENTRSQKIKDAAQKIQGFWRMKKLSRHFRLLQNSIMKLQPRIRGWLGRRAFRKMWIERDQRRAKAETLLLSAEDKYCKAVWDEIMKVERDRQAAERQLLKNEEKFQREVALALVKIEKIRQYNESKKLRQEEIYQIQVMIAIEQQKAAEKAKLEAAEAERKRKEAEAAAAAAAAEKEKLEQEERKKREAELAEKAKKEAEELAKKTAEAAKSPAIPDDDTSAIDQALQDLINDTELQKQSLEITSPIPPPAPAATVSPAPPIVPSPPTPPISTSIPAPPAPLGAAPTTASVPPPPPPVAPATDLKPLPDLVPAPAVVEPPAPPPAPEAPSNLMNRLAAMDDLDDLDSILNQLEGEKAEIEKKIADVAIPEPVEKTRKATIYAPTQAPLEKIRRATITSPAQKVDENINSTASAEDPSPQAQEKAPFVAQIGCYVRALFDYEQDGEDLLSLKAGELIIVIQVDDSGWCRGECNTEVGWFPLEFVEPADEDVGEEDTPNEPMESGQIVRALFDFVGADSSQLSFKAGQLITIVENDESGWCQGTVGEEIGWFPYDYVEVVEKEVAKKKQEPPKMAPPKAEEANTFVECSIEVSLPKDIHRYSFEEYAKKNFAQQRTGTFRKKTVDAVDLILFSKEPIKAPLLAMHSPESADALIQLSHSIMKYMGDYSSKREPEEHLMHVISSGIANEEYRDEIYSNLCKQLSNNSNPESTRLGWELMSVCVGVFPPSKNMELYLQNFFKQFTRISGEVGNAANFCQKTLARSLVNGARKFVPTPKEIEVMKKKKPYILRIYFIDGESKGCAVELQTTVKEVTAHMCKRLGIRAHQAFALYDQSSGHEVLLKPQQLIMDLLAEWESKNITDGRLVFKNLLFLKSFNETKEEGLINILYKQTVKLVLNGTYICTNEEALTLGALQCIVDIGSSKTTVKHLAGSDPEKYLPARCVAGKTPVECVKLLTDKYQTLISTGKNHKNAKENYIALCKTWSFYGMAFYQMEQSVSVGNVPTKFILGANADGVHFLDINTKATLRSLRYGEVTNWGFSASTFVIITGDLRHQQKFLLKTKQGTEISELVQSYINCIVD